MLPKSEDYMAVLSQHTKFTNKEGIFGDADIISLTRNDSEHAIPTYQFWAEHGKLVHVLHNCIAVPLLLHQSCTTQLPFIPLGLGFYAVSKVC